MVLPLGFGELDFGDWFKGLVAAFVSGGASSVTSGFAVGVVDSKDFNVGDPAKLIKVMAVSFLMSGIMSMMLFLRNKPVPEGHHEVQTQPKP